MRTRLDRSVTPLATALLVAHGIWLAGVVEDAFISFRFAHHLAAGAGFRWNLGEPPVEGFTNLLWVLLAVIPEALGLDTVAVMQLLGFAAAVGTLWLVDRFAHRVLGLAGPARWLPSVLLALSGPFAAWSSSALETPFFTFLVTAALYLGARAAGTGASKELILAWVAVALATLTRPEGLLLAIALTALTLERRGPGWSFRSAVWIGIGAGAFGLFLVALTAWRLATFGVPLPNTFYAKTGGGFAQVVRGATYSGYFGLHFLLPLVPLAVVGIGLGPAGANGQRRPLAVLAGWLGVYTLYIIAVGGDYMAMYRFFVPLLPALYLLGAAAAAPLFAGPRRLATAGAVLAGLAAVGTVVHSLPLEAALFAKAPRQHGTYRGVETERWHVNRLHRLTRFFAERAAGRPQASVATGAIGVIGYRSDLTVFDFHGLVDPVIAQSEEGQRPLGTGLPGHEKVDWGHLLDRRPTFWMFTRALRDEPADWPRYDDATDARLRAEYRLESVLLDDELTGERGLFTFLERREDLPE